MVTLVVSVRGKFTIAPQCITIAAESKGQFIILKKPS